MDKRKTLFILIAGLEGHGKTTLAHFIKDLLSDHGRSDIKHFADLVKSIYAQNSDANLERLHLDRDYKEKHRKNIIALAEGYKVVHGKDFWARAVTEEVAYINSNWVIVPDLRFPEEIDHFNQQKLNYVTIFITTAHCSQPKLTHPYDFFIYNDGTPRGLQNAATLIVNALI